MAIDWNLIDKELAKDDIQILEVFEDEKIVEVEIGDIRHNVVVPIWTTEEIIITIRQHAEDLR